MVRIISTEACGFRNIFCLVFRAIESPSFHDDSSSVIWRRRTSLGYFRAHGLTVAIRIRSGHGVRFIDLVRCWMLNAGPVHVPFEKPSISPNAHRTQRSVLPSNVGFEERQVPWFIYSLIRTTLSNRYKKLLCNEIPPFYVHKKGQPLM